MGTMKTTRRKYRRSDRDVIYVGAIRPQDSGEMNISLCSDKPRLSVYRWGPINLIRATRTFLRRALSRRALTLPTFGQPSAKRFSARMKSIASFASLTQLCSAPWEHIKPSPALCEGAPLPHIRAAHPQHFGTSAFLAATLAQETRSGPGRPARRSPSDVREHSPAATQELTPYPLLSCRPQGSAP